MKDGSAQSPVKEQRTDGQGQQNNGVEEQTTRKRDDTNGRVIGAVLVSEGEVVIQPPVVEITESESEQESLQQQTGSLGRTVTQQSQVTDDITSEPIEQLAQQQVASEEVVEGDGGEENELVLVEDLWNWLRIEVIFKMAESEGKQENPQVTEPPRVMGEDFTTDSMMVNAPREKLVCNPRRTGQAP